MFLPLLKLALDKGLLCNYFAYGVFAFSMGTLKDCSIYCVVYTTV